jgi:hypothetical protein
VYMLVFAGGFSVGSAIWGAVATHQNLKVSLLYSAGGLGLGLLAAIRYPVRIQVESDVTPSLHWGEPHLLLEPRPEHGPVLVTLEYLIDTQDKDQFAKAMRNLSIIRRRDGAIRWGLFQDAANPGRFLETFIVETWMEHRRQHERMTMADRSVEEQAFSFHVGGERPRVQHLIYAYSKRGRNRKKYIRSLK